MFGQAQKCTRQQRAAGRRRERNSAFSQLISSREHSPFTYIPRGRGRQYRSVWAVERVAESESRIGSVARGRQTFTSSSSNRTVTRSAQPSGYALCVPARLRIRKTPGRLGQ